jgi:hypothetical protein
MYLNEHINRHLLSKSALKVEKFPAFYPSSASCIDQTDNVSVVGTCLRQQYFKYKGFKESDPSGLYSQWIFAAGNMWEDYLIEQLKQTGLWLANSVKFNNLDLFVSGEIDILIKGPNYNATTGTGKWIVENKTYSSSNYNAKKEIVGARDKKPKPKDLNVIQSFIYLCTFSDQVDVVVLNYIDRACGGPENNKEFHINVYEDDGDFYPQITTKDFFGNDYSYIERRISYNGIKNRFTNLIEYLKSNEIPDPEFQHKLTDEQIQTRYKLGLIAKTKYEAYQTNAERNPIGDFQCSPVYCNFSTLCAAQKTVDGHM